METNSSALSCAKPAPSSDRKHCVVCCKEDRHSANDTHTISSSNASAFGCRRVHPGKQLPPPGTRIDFPKIKPEIHTFGITTGRNECAARTARRTVNKGPIWRLWNRTVRSGGTTAKARTSARPAAVLAPMIALMSSRVAADDPIDPTRGRTHCRATASPCARRPRLDSSVA